jgi:hypothetical protein
MAADSIVDIDSKAHVVIVISEGRAVRVDRPNTALANPVAPDE